MHIISKDFEFDFGHRVHTQCPDPVLSCNHQSVCRHLHGHRGVVKVSMSSEELDPHGMVTDFVNLQWFKKFLDDVIDHKMVLDIADPVLLHLFPLLETGSDILDKSMLTKHMMIEFDDENKNQTPVYWNINMDHPNFLHVDPCVKEIYEGLIFVPFVPTSEYLSKWFYEITSAKLKKIGVTVSRIDFKETPKSNSIFQFTV